MKTGKYLVLARDADCDELVRRIAEYACPGWREKIEVRPVPSNLLATPMSARVLDLISREWYDGSAVQIFVDDQIKVNCSRLRQDGVKVRVCSRASIFAEVLDHLKHNRAHWLTRSVSEWDNSAIKFLHPQAWREQFAEFGHAWVGEALLKQLRVITDSELRSRFVVQKKDVVGLRVIHGYVSDSEPGSSSTNIKDLLEHSYTDRIVAVELDRGPPDECKGADVLYLYEDGLWSGVELVRRLALISSWSVIKSRELRVVLKFGATTDAGLLAARNFLRRERMTSVEVAPGRVESYDILRDGFADSVVNSEPLHDDDLRHAIDSSVAPYAFRSGEIWPNGAADAISICREIGAQLVEPWLLRTKGTEKLAERTDKWALGALGFASMVVFSKSVPKPVLPLVWLNGQVEKAGRRVNWRPLFWDARRTGETAPPNARH